MTILHEFGSVLERPLDTSFGLSVSDAISIVISRVNHSTNSYGNSYGHVCLWVPGIGHLVNVEKVQIHLYFSTFMTTCILGQQYPTNLNHVFQII